jgi:tRNA(fMet)-specific endonuclease VapC
VNQRFLLDTNIISALMRDPQGSVAAKIEKLGDTEIFTSVIVAAELHYGIIKKGSARLKESAEAILASLEIRPFTPEAAIAYGNLRAKLEHMGRIIGANDLLIAAHAIAEDAVLVTDNLGEFTRVAGLKTQNWLR